MLVEYMYVSIRSIYSLAFVLLNAVVVCINKMMKEYDVCMSTVVNMATKR